ncbi:autotransporter outer membrane beta-barrel domain-containing protein [Mesorhizobium loti]|nr:autotransporter outer membrane beta-barrel domain-containing protein [Mesorhizobium loti]
MRKNLRSQASRLALRSAIGIAAFAGASLLVPGQARADCVVGATIQCDDTFTTDTTYSANPPYDRNYVILSNVPVVVDVIAGATVSGNGLAVANTGDGGVSVINNGVIRVDPDMTPTAGGTAALSVSAAGGVISYTGGDIANYGDGNAFDATQTGGVGSVDINVAGNVFAATGQGITVRDVATSTGISVVANNVTALDVNKDAINVRSVSTTGNVTIVANGNLQAGNAGIVGLLLPGSTGNVEVTANGSIDARFGIDAENFGAGSTAVTAVGPVTATTGNGIFARSTGGAVTVTAGDVTSTGNTAIIARQTKAGAAGAIDVTVGNVSGTTGIEATNSGTGAIGIIANGTVTGTLAEGIKATGNGAVSVSVADTVTGTTGLLLTGGSLGSGNISVTGAGGFVGGTGYAAEIQNNGAGTVTVDISGASSSSGGGGIYVGDTAIGGDISVTTGAVTALTAGKNGIVVQSASLTGNVTIVANGDVHAGYAGILTQILPAAATGNIDVTANGSIDAGSGIYAEFGIYAENFGAGSTTVTAVGPVTVTGNGIFAQSTVGDVTVTAGDVTSTGTTAILAIAQPGAVGAVNVTAGNVSGTIGIHALNSGSGAIGIIANGTVTGTLAAGINATGNDAVSVSVADTVTGTTGLLLTGGSLGSGDISVTGTGGFVGGTGYAADIQNNGAGTVTVDISGASSSSGGEGIYVRDTAIGGGISVTTGAVTALTANAIYVQSASLTGNVTIVANGDLQAGHVGIIAQILPPTPSTGNVDVTANGSIDASFGIYAYNYGTGSTTVTAVGPVAATTGTGIDALARGGNVTVTAGDVTSTNNIAIRALQSNVAAASAVNVTAGNVSGTTGINATNYGTLAINIIANGTVTGTLAEGIKATGNGAVSVSVADTVTGTTGLLLTGGTLGSGDISVTGAGGFVGGAGNAATIQNNGAGTVTVDISGASSSTGGNGFYVRDTAIGGDISVTTGAVTALAAGRNGIDVQSVSLTGNVAIVANGDLQAGYAGIVAQISPAAATGNIDVTANGSVDADFGIYANNKGTGSTTVTTLGPVTTTTGTGIFAQSAGGDIAVNAGDVTSTGNVGIFALQAGTAAGTVDVSAGKVSGTTGIYAYNGGTGATTVTAVGPVIATTGRGISAQSTGGNVTVTAGDVTSTGNIAIIAQQIEAGAAGAIIVTTGNVSGTTGITTLDKGTGATAIITNGTVKGDIAAISATSTNGNAIGITLSGATHNSALTAAALAITTSDGATTILNGGALTGRVELGDYADLVTNYATWTTGGTSLFGAGIDTVTNTAAASLRTASNGATQETTTFSGLELLSNAGRLTMQDGGAGDRTELAGTVTLAAGSTYAIDVNAALQSDLLHTTGVATITGSTLAVTAQGITAGRYTVLTADLGLTGEFAAVTGVTSTAFLSVTDTYDLNNAYLDVLVYGFNDAGLTPNQIAIGSGAESLGSGNPLYDAILLLPTEAAARDAFDQLSGEVHASAKGMLVEDSRFVRDAVTNRVMSAFGDIGAAALPVMAYGEGGPEMVAADTDRFAVWGQAFGSWGNADSDGNAAAFDRSTGGLLAGADTSVGSWRVGLLGGYSHSSFNADDRNSSGKADSYHLGLYGGTNWGAIAFRTGAAYSWSSFSTKRSIAFDGFTDGLSADYDAGTAQIFGELAYKADAGRFKFEPFANLAYVSAHTDGFTETGGASALTSAGSTTDATFTTLGVRGSTDFSLGGMNATARAMLGWRHAFGDVTPTSSFAFAGGDAFTIAGAPIARDAAVIEAGLDLNMSANATLGVSYTGQFGGGGVDQGAKVDLDLRF